MDKNNEKIVVLNEKKKGRSANSASDNPWYEGFEYTKRTRDVNGFSLNFEHLKNYGEKNRYAISVLRKIKNKTYIYNYFVKNEELPKFFKCYFDGKIEGEIIEIEKLDPENLA